MMPGARTQAPESILPLERRSASNGRKGLVMLSEEFSRALLVRSDLTQEEIVLVCLATRSFHGKSVAEVRSFATHAGIRSAWSWNISSILGQSRGRALRTQHGWQLTVPGWNTVREIAEKHLARTVWRGESFDHPLSTSA
jgi:hypothetical protein